MPPSSSLRTAVSPTSKPPLLTPFIPLFRGFTISYRSVPNPPEKSAASPAIYWIVLCCLVTVMVTVLVSAVVVVYRKRTANRPLESISNPIYGFSNVHDVLVFPNDE